MPRSGIRAGRVVVVVVVVVVVEVVVVGNVVVVEAVVVEVVGDIEVEPVVKLVVVELMDVVDVGLRPGSVVPRGFVAAVVIKTDVVVTAAVAVDARAVGVGGVVGSTTAVTSGSIAIGNVVEGTDVVTVKVEVGVSATCKGTCAGTVFALAVPRKLNTITTARTCLTRATWKRSAVVNERGAWCDMGRSVG